MTHDLGRHFLDTGPLLCLGLSTKTAGDLVIADYFDSEFLCDTQVVEAVVSELTRLARENLLPGHPKARAQRKKAAGAACYRYRLLLETPVSRPVPEPTRLHKIEAALVRLANSKYPGRSVGGNEHRGEAESIYWAGAEGVSIVTCDNDAHRVANHLNVPSVTFVEIARRVSRRRKEITRQALYDELQAIMVSGIDIGERLTSPLDLA